MKCIFCKQGETKKGFTTVTLNRKNTVIIIKEVPSDICENCGEYYLTAKMTKKLLSLAETAISKGAEVEILRFAA
jgi:YgiT-type zinc finger domain-containing protein